MSFVEPCLTDQFRMVGMRVQISRSLKIERLLLCSTDDEKVRGMWESCGFEYTQGEDVENWDIRQGDLIYMTNTVQMHKRLPKPRPYRPIIIQHGAFRTCVYAPLDTGKGEGLTLLREAEVAHARKRIAPGTGGPPKKVAKKAKPADG
jgi:hypothetical protein